MTKYIDTNKYICLLTNYNIYVRKHAFQVGYLVDNNSLSVVSP